MEIYNVNTYDTMKEVQYFEHYTVQKNETLFQLAKKKNVNPKLLAVLNGLTEADTIIANQVIMIPKSDYSYYITKEGDSLNGVAKMFNSSLLSLITDNQTIYLQEGQLMVSKFK